MNSTMRQIMAVVLMIFGAMQSAAFEYNVRRPSTVARPRWQGARVGEWTMDYKAARSQAVAEGRGLILFTTGSWWCPHCEAFEEKVLLANAARWRDYIQEKGYYLVMLDFPYRGHVDDSQLWKSKYPEYGDGWGLQCWLYDDDYLDENKLSREDGLNAIMDFYRLQKSLAIESATTVSIKTWDGAEDFTYGKVGYPTLIVYLPDGSEAGRFSPGSTNLDADKAYNYVVEKIDSIVGDALNESCGLCTEPEEWGLAGDTPETYRGWISGVTNGIIGIFEADVGRKNYRGDIKINVTTKIAAETSSFVGYGKDSCIEMVTLSSKKKSNALVELMFDDIAVSGTYSENGCSYTIKGTRDVFKASDKVAKERRSALVPGVWTFAMCATNTTSDFGRGYGVFSVKVERSGTVWIRGILPNGQSVLTISNVVVGDAGVYCVPISVNKDCDFGCCLWFKNGLLFNITDIRMLTTYGKNSFQSWWRAIYSSVPYTAGVSGDYELVIPEIPEAVLKKQLKEQLVADINGEAITIAKKKWTGTGLSQFKARMNELTGIISGSMKSFIECSEEPCKVSGVIIDGTVYCSALMKGEGSYMFRVSACNACED